MYLLLLEHLISIGNIVFRDFFVPYELLNDHCEVILHVTGYWPQSYILNLTLILHPLLYCPVLSCPVLSSTLPVFCCHCFLCHTSCVRYTKKHCVLIYDTYVKMGYTRKTVRRFWC